MDSAKILVVDDSIDNLLLTQILLEGEGHQIRTALEAEQALQILQYWRPHLILMDLQLPGMDGLELTRKLRQDPDLGSIPIVAITAYAMGGDEEKARAAGCAGYITKPIDTRKFPGEVARFLHPVPAAS